MNNCVVSVPKFKSLRVVDGQSYPVARIFCVGRNFYANDQSHGQSSEREPPFFFAKTWDTLLSGGAVMPYPPATNCLHYEMELVIALKAEAFQVATGSGNDFIWGCAAGIDMTRRDLQNAARTQGRPWEMGKIFDGAAPVGELVPFHKCPDLSNASIELLVNGEVRQKGSLSDIIWTPGELVEWLSSMVRLGTGDLIFTGTPPGVGELHRGDSVVGQIGGLPPVVTKIV